MVDVIGNMENFERCMVFGIMVDNLKLNTLFLYLAKFTKPKAIYRTSSI